MTSVTEVGESASWLKQRSSIFNGANTPKAPKVVDKELARLKSSGVVSSIWSNKFVQEDNPGAKRASLNAFLQKDATSPKSSSFNTSFNKQRSSIEAEITKTDNATKKEGDQQITPENKIAPATSLVQANNNMSSVTEKNTTNNVSTIVKNDKITSSPVQQTFIEQEKKEDEEKIVQEVKEEKVDNIPVEAIVEDEITKVSQEKVTSHSVDIAKEEVVAEEPRLVKELEQVPPFVATTVATEEKPSSPKLLEETPVAKDVTDAKVSENIESADDTVTANDAKEIKNDQSSGEKATTPATFITHDASVSVTSLTPFSHSQDSFDTAAALWFQIEALKTKYAQEHARLERAYEDIEFYKHQLEIQSEANKETLANAMEEKEKEALRVRQLAELIVKQDQLLNEYEINLAALTRLTDEATYLQETQAEMEGLRKELADLNQQKKYMQGAIDSLRGELEMSYSQMRLVMAVSTEIQNDFEKQKERSNKELQDTLEQKASEHKQQIEDLHQQIKQLTDSQQQAITAGATLEHVREVSTSTEELDALKEEVAQLKNSLEKKDATIQAMEKQMKDQKTDLENQIIELSQTIIEKDAHLLEIMNSRNTSESSIIGHMPPPPDSLYNQRYSYDNESQFHINQVRDYMLSSSDDDDDEDEREVLHLSYSSDEDDLMMHHNAPLESPGTNSVTSTITFGSSEEEEEQGKMSDLKHFSYTSVTSQNLTDETEQTINGIHDTFIAKENSSKWPMPPPTPPPSEPLPPVPAVDTVVPPPRRARAKTLVRSESSSPVSNELPRILPLQKTTPVIETTPVPPPRKNIPHRNSQSLSVDHANEIDGYQHTKWMDDPESEDDRVKDEWKAL